MSIHRMGRKSTLFIALEFVLFFYTKASHFALGHLDKVSPAIQDEVEADFSSFGSIYSDISENEKFSANCGVLCALFSLLYLNPTIEPDNIHPTEDERIF